jgi:hypothetical protein
VVYQLTRTYAEGASEAEDQRQLRNVVASFRESDLKRRRTGFLGKSFLSPAASLPPLANGFTERDRLASLLLSRRHAIELCHGKH